MFYPASIDLMLFGLYGLPGSFKKPTAAKRTLISLYSLIEHPSLDCAAEAFRFHNDRGGASV